MDAPSTQSLGTNASATEALRIDSEMMRGRVADVGRGYIETFFVEAATQFLGVGDARFGVLFTKLEGSARATASAARRPAS